MVFRWFVIWNEVRLSLVDIITLFSLDLLNWSAYCYCCFCASILRWIKGVKLWNLVKVPIISVIISVFKILVGLKLACTLLRYDMQWNKLLCGSHWCVYAKAISKKNWIRFDIFLVAEVRRLLWKCFDSEWSFGSFCYSGVKNSSYKISVTIGCIMSYYLQS